MKCNECGKENPHRHDPDYLCAACISNLVKYCEEKKGQTMKSIESDKTDTPTKFELQNLYGEPISTPFNIVDYNECSDSKVARFELTTGEKIQVKLESVTMKQFLDYKYPNWKLMKNSQKANTDKVGTGLVLIPWYSILELGKIFVEGLRYGRDNWKKGVYDKTYQEERLEHAMLHLLKWKEGDRSEQHLAKVMWFCATQLELERLERDPVKQNLQDF